MLILGLDSSTDRVSAALVEFLGDGGGDLLSSQEVAASRYSETTIPLIQGLFSSCNRSPNELDGIAVGVGPGSLTGLRVGIATAKTLAQTLRVPLAGVASLDTLLLQAEESNTEPTVAALDARRGEIYRISLHAQRASGERPAPELVSVADFIHELTRLDEEATVVGTAANLLETFLSDTSSEHDSQRAQLSSKIRLGTDALRHPSPVVICRLAREELSAGDRQSVFGIGPLYWRPADALTLAERRAKKANKAANNEETKTRA